jgi:hypothetical protein
MHPAMTETVRSLWQELSTPSQIEQLGELARHRRWSLALVLVGWLHLLAFSLCYYLTIFEDYHQPAGYLAIWVSELLGAGLIFRSCGGSRAPRASLPLERFIVRVWAAYFLLAFNLGTMNTLRGHTMFEFFPAMASLASFAFLVMTFAVSRRFFAAVLVMFISGLLMSAYLWHAYLIFAIAWWLVLNATGMGLWRHGHLQAPPCRAGQPRGGVRSARCSPAVGLPDVEATVHPAVEKHLGNEGSGPFAGLPQTELG